MTLRIMFGKLTLALLLLAVAGASSLPSAIAAATEVKVADPTRDITISQSGVLVPVDSIDIVDLGVVERHKGVVSGSIGVVDLSRRGLEDRAFVVSEHRVRQYSLFTTFADGRLLILVMATIDDGSAPFATAALLTQEGVTVVPVRAEVDLAASMLRWKLDKAIDGEVTGRYATANLVGCTDLETCDPSVAYFSAMDAAPNDVHGPNMVVIPGWSWAELLPEDDGSVPRAPVSPAPTYKTIFYTIFG